jgi:two-component system, OmpR family, response regulator TctD
MPGMDRLELLRRTKERRSEPPVSVVTACADEGCRQRAVELGAPACLAKPSDYTELKARLAELGHGAERGAQSQRRRNGRQ